MLEADKPLIALLVALCVVACSSNNVERAQSSLEVPQVPFAKQPRLMSRTIVTDSYHIDKKYKSMMGPSSQQKVTLLESEQPELLWIVGYDAVVVNDEGTENVSQEFMCHSNLDFDPGDYWKNFRSDASMSGRLFTLSQGVQDIRFPRGFGIPVMSDMNLALATQVLNLNLPDPSLDVRHKVTIHFTRESEAPGAQKPLFQAAVQGFKSLEEHSADYGVQSQSGGESHEGCSVGLPAVQGDSDKDKFGQKFTGHWVVKPGREVNTTLVTNFLQLQFDTTIHYIAVHMHPFAESLELVDKTTRKSVFKAQAKNTKDKIGLEHIDHFISADGIPIHKDHNYELISIYDNTSGEDQDSMAVMYLYLHDRHFHMPKPDDTQAKG